MENKAKNQPKSNNNKGQNKTNYDYDIFISYRQFNNSRSLARTLEKDFKNESLEVFFDCSTKTLEGWERINKSRYIIILVTKESLETVCAYHYDTINTNEEMKEGGFNFAKELYKIEEGLKYGGIKENNVLLLNIDCEHKTQDIQNVLSESKYEKLGSKVEIVPFHTGKTYQSSFYYLYSRIQNQGDKIEISESNHKRYKTISKLAVLCGVLFMIVLGLLGVTYYKYKDLQNTFDNRLNDSTASKKKDLDEKYGDSLTKLNDELNQYKTECIIFAGGGTVQQYIDSVYRDSGVNIKQYKPNPGSKYIHLPSTTAWQLLWDDVNEGLPRQYCPVVLSAGKIDTKGVDIEKFKLTRRIAEYKIDSIPLKVQINDHKKYTGTITIDSLKKILSDTSKYEIWTTTKESGTYFEYNNLFDGVLNLDSIVNSQSGGWKNFNLNGFVGNHDPKKTQIILANECYNLSEKQKDLSDYTIISDENSKEIKTEKLYVYTIATIKQDGSSLELLPAAEKFLYNIGCNTAEPKTTINTDSTGVIVTWYKR